MAPEHIKMPLLSTASVIFRTIEIYFLLILLSPILCLNATTIQCIVLPCLLMLLFINGNLSEITLRTVILTAIQCLAAIMYVVLLFHQNLQEHLVIWLSLILLFFIMRMCDFLEKAHQRIVREFTYV